MIFFLRKLKHVCFYFLCVFLTLQAGPFLANASILAQNYIGVSMPVALGMEIYKYELETLETYDSQAEFAAESFSTANFEAGEDDLEALVAADDLIRLNHYGDSPPDTTIVDWWDDDSDSSTKYNWRYRQCVALDHTAAGAVNQTEYQIYFDFDTATLVTAGKMLASGDDIRFTDQDSNELPFYIADDMNTASTRIWVQMDTIPAAATEQVCMYYGYVGSGAPTSASDANATFSYSSQQPIYYQIQEFASGAIVDIGSYIEGVNSNNVSFGPFTNNFSQYGVSSGIAAQNQETSILVEGSIAASFSNNDTDTVAPISFAGEYFVHYAVRNTDRFHFVAPFSTATVTIEEFNGTNWVAPCAGNVFNVLASSSTNLNCDITNNRAYRIFATAPVLAQHSRTNGDTHLLYPAEKTLQNDSGRFEVWGVGSNNARFAVDFDSPLCNGGSQVDIYRSNGARYDNYGGGGINVNFNNYTENIGGGSNEGRSDAFHIISDCPVGGASSADGDGGEQSLFMPQQEFHTEFLITQNTQYVAGAAKDVAVTCEMFNAAGVLVETDVSTGGTGGEFPDKIYFPNTDNGSDGTRYTPGFRVICDQPIFAYFEYSGTNDETNFMTFPQGRKRAEVEPTIGDLDTATEEGLYYESGFDSAGPSSDPEAFWEVTLDLTGLGNSIHTFWNEVSWQEVLIDRSGENSVNQLTFEVATAAPSPTCATAVYTFSVPGQATLASSIDSTPLFSTEISNDKRIQFPDNQSDQQCMRLRAFLRTGDEAYTPRLEQVEISYFIPSILADQLNSPIITITGNNGMNGGNDRVRILKMLTNNTNLTNSAVELSFAGVSTPGAFSTADFEFIEIPGYTSNPQFDYPPFSVVPPEVNSGSPSTFDDSNDIAVYFDHTRSGTANENIDLIIKNDITSSGGPEMWRELRLTINGV